MKNKHASMICPHPIEQMYSFSRAVFCLTLLAFFLAMLFAPKTVFAEVKEGMCGDELIYKYDDEAQTLLIAGTGDMYDYKYGNSPFDGMRFETLTVQEKTHGTGITSIGDYAFNRCRYLTTVSLPETLTKIGKGSFSSCSSLKVITLPKNVTSIGDYAFNSCSSLQKVNLSSSGITSIGSFVFSYCSKLSEIQLPKTLTSLGDDTFDSCYALTTIAIPNTLSTIPIGTFRYCSALKTVTIPKTITKIGNFAFDRCYNIKTIYYDGTTKEWFNIDIGDSSSGNYVIYGVNLIYINSEPIPFSGIVSLSSTAYVFSGSAKKPTVSVKYLGGKLLKNGTDYTVAYTNNTRVGSATVTVNFKGKYKGTVKKSFTIHPIKPNLLSLKSSAKKQLLLKWRKDTGLTGFQIQYASNASFSKAKTLTVKATAVKNTIKGLKSKKKYYVRLRAYKKVANKNYYSSWSNQKSAKVK